MSEKRKRRHRTQISPIDSDFEPGEETAPRNTQGKKKSRRRSPRLSVKKGVKVAHVNDADANQEILGVTSNLGTGGLFVQTHELLPVGTVVLLRISLEENEELISIRSRVIRAAEAPVRGMAVVFDTGEPDLDHRMIEKYVRTHASRLAQEAPMTAPPAEMPGKLVDDEKTIVSGAPVALPSETTSSHVVLDEVRKTKQQYIERLRALESRRRNADTELALAKEELARARESLERERREVEAEREELAEERQTIGQTLVRERTSTSKQTALRQKELQEQISRMHERLTELANANEALKVHCSYLENRRAAERNAAGNNSDPTASATKTRAEIAAVRAREEAVRSILEAKVEELRKELAGKDQEIDTAQREAKFRIWRAERQIERVRSDLEDELDQVDEARAQAIVDLNRAHEEKEERLADIRRLELELEEKDTRLQLSKAEYSELAAQMQDERQNSLTRCRQLEATIHEMRAVASAAQPSALPGTAGTSQWFGEIPVTVTPVKPDTSTGGKK